MIQSIDQYLSQLQEELAGSDQEIIQEALSDTEEYLRSALNSVMEATPNVSEAAALESIIEEYGTPQEVADTYKEVQSLSVHDFANGRYRIKRFLGEGGVKKVYAAYDTQLYRDVVLCLIKTESIPKNYGTPDDIKRRRNIELQAMGKLGTHPNIITMYDIGEYEGQPCWIIDYMTGGDVESLIAKAPKHQLPIDQAVRIAKNICQGLEFAHSKGVIHRDIKPGNMWLTEDGIVKIGDFGLAVIPGTPLVNEEGMIVGTASYLPPEQAVSGPVTPQSDLYSLGAMLYEMVTGQPPFLGDNVAAIINQHINTLPVSPSSLRNDLPPQLETIIMKLLEKDPEKRPASAADVLITLEAIPLH